MERILLILALGLLLGGCSTLQKVSPIAMAAASIAGAYMSKESLAVSKKEQEISVEMREINAENTCVSQLRGSIDQWPRICEKTRLSRMDACGRAGFDSTPLCTDYLKQYVARTQTQETQQQVSQSNPKAEEKKKSAEKPRIAKNTKAKPAVAVSKKTIPVKNTKKETGKKPQAIKVGTKSI